jgi:hypothetical protein
MQEIVLHIGRHKSGTSSLQHFFVTNATLLEGLGYLYPVTMRRAIAHHRLADFFNDKTRAGMSPTEWGALDEEYALFCKETDAADKVLVSSEALQNVAPTAVARHLGDAVKVVVYIREQTEYLISSYAQAVQNQKLTLSLKEYEEKRFHADYYGFLTAWESAFPKGSLTVRLYDRNEFEGADVRLDFLSVLGLLGHKDRFEFSADDRNPSIGGVLLEFKRCLNEVDFESVIAKPALYNLLSKAALLNPKLIEGSLWSDGLIDAVHKKYSASNQAVCDKYFPGREVLFKIRGKPLGSREPSASFADVAQTINELTPGLGGKLLALIR